MTTSLPTLQKENPPPLPAFAHGLASTAEHPPGRSAPEVTIRQSLRSRPPRYWSCACGRIWTPVVDKVSRDLFEALRALDSGQLPLAALKMRSVTSGLRAHAVLAASDNGAGAIAAERRQSQDVAWRLASSAVRSGLAASGIEGGHVRSRADFDSVFTADNWVDADLRWRFVDRGAWFPVCGEAQRHMVACAAGVDSRFLVETTIVEICKACSYLRLEAARASGFAQIGLAAALGAMADLVRRLAVSAQWHPQEAQATFARASLALALSHRNRASEAWLCGDLQDAGYEFAAAGSSFANALGWSEGRAAPLACTIALRCTELGDRLISRDAPSRADVLAVVRDFGVAVDALRRKVAPLLAEAAMDGPRQPRASL